MKLFKFLVVGNNCRKFRQVFAKNTIFMFAKYKFKPKHWRNKTPKIKL